MKRFTLLLGSLAILGLLSLATSHVPINATGAYEATYNIDIALSPANGFLTGRNMKPGDQVTSLLEVENKGNVDFNYTVRSRKEAGDEPLYNQMTLKISDGTGLLYEGPMNGLQNFPLGTIASFQKTSLTFTAALPYETDNEFQGKETTVAFDFTAIGHDDQLPGDGECFEPPFSNRNFTLHQKSTVPIKFHLNNPETGEMESSPLDDVRLEVKGPDVRGGHVTYLFAVDDGTLKFDQKVDEPHYLARFSTFDYPVKTDSTYTATVYVGDTAVCKKDFMVLEQGNRSNAP